MDQTKWKFTVFEIAKWLVLLLAVAFLVAITAQGRSSRTDFETMSTAVTGAADLSNVQEGDSQMVKRLYGLDPAEFEGVVLYYPTTNMGAEEILLVKLSSTGQQEAVTAAIQARVEAQKSAFEGYGVDQYDMLERSILEVRGNYILFVSAEDPAPVRQAFLNAL